MRALSGSIRCQPFTTGMDRKAKLPMDVLHDNQLPSSPWQVESATFSPSQLASECFHEDGPEKQRRRFLQCLCRLYEMAHRALWTQMQLGKPHQPSRSCRRVLVGLTFGALFREQTSEALLRSPFNSPHALTAVLLAAIRW
jgi:hypothetical protein